MKNVKSDKPDPTTPEGLVAWLERNAKKALDAAEKEAASGPKRFAPGEALEDVVPDDLGT